ncbi:MAG: hypothetical protein DI551_06655 [Micavibrio aeruginosavorus]|uniref:Uncharacterized protein n=1 Tax=Micavibrio aeruginosavorus TaxID=349221 RepID=A0A2W5MY02_9BACT|nr:MAG: hypothetical protein DI551_06655 [Micavibrio aeruginosavorus]
MDMKSKNKDADLTAIAPEPTIWALRHNPRATANLNGKGGQDGLYQHLFGYNPIDLLGQSLAAEKRPAVAHGASAENPNLNIIQSETNFLLMEIASEMPPDAQ